MAELVIEAGPNELFDSPLDCTFTDPHAFGDNRWPGKREILLRAGLLERLPLKKEGKLRQYKLDGLVERLQGAAAVGLVQREYHLMGKGDEDS